MEPGGSSFKLGKREQTSAIDWALVANMPSRNV